MEGVMMAIKAATSINSTSVHPRWSPWSFFKPFMVLPVDRDIKEMGGVMQVIGKRGGGVHPITFHHQPVITLGEAGRGSGKTKGQGKVPGDGLGRVVKPRYRGGAVLHELPGVACIRGVFQVIDHIHGFGVGTGGEGASVTGIFLGVVISRRRADSPEPVPDVR